eukprot:gene16451-7865_t
MEKISAVSFLLLLGITLASMVPLNCNTNRPISKVGDYLAERQKLIAEDAAQRTGQQIILTDKEKKANDILMAWKRKELDAAFTSGKFIGAESFITTKTKIVQSKVFQIIKKMPKGADLHLHDMTVADFKWLISNITTLDSCYMCYNMATKLTQFKVSFKQPNSTATCEWISTPMARKKSGDPKKFDEELFTNLTMTNGDPSKLYPTQNARWVKFQSVFYILSGLLEFKNAFSWYYEKGLEELVEDNIQYAELRALLFPLHDGNGKIYSDPEYVLNLYKNVTDAFVAKNPNDFFGTKIIYTQTRFLERKVIGQAVQKAMYMHKKYPDLMAGFDLVGQEDRGNPLLYYLNELLIPAAAGESLPYYFHAGETSWEGQSVDYNIVDALLLNTRRIGHGFALSKHKVLMDQAKSKSVAVEVCPISNQVLGLVTDMRSHPATVFLDQNFPMTVNSDDPPIWGATGLSYDYYHVFMAMTRYDTDIRVLKQLALNSIMYCSLEKSRKAKLRAMWTRKWDEFISTVISDFSFPT